MACEICVQFVKDCVYKYEKHDNRLVENVHLKEHVTYYSAK